MDKITKNMTIAAAVVIIASGSHYLWNAHRTDLANRCKQDGIVQAFLSVGLGPETSNYADAIQLCFDRGYPKK